MRTTARSAVATAAVVLALAAAACGRGDRGGGVATARRDTSPSATPVADQAQLAQRYIECMRGQGVAMSDALTGEGVPQIDKTNAARDRIGPAMEHCREFLPAGEEAVTVAPEDVERLRRYAACLRDNGVPDYPDPDPETGEPVMTGELASRLKEDPNLPRAMQACKDQAPGSGDGIVGG